MRSNAESHINDLGCVKLAATVKSPALGLKVEQIPIDRVVPYEKNPRKGGAVDKVAASLREFGWKQPIVVDGEMVVIAGHTRLAAARQLGMAEVPVVIAGDLDPVKVKAYRIADNRSAQDATWDAELLGFELADLKELAYDLPLLGFTEQELMTFLPSAAARDDEDEVPEPPAAPVSRLGDLWHLGNHLLLCGDATSVDEVKRLLGDLVPDMAWCDPPYGINVVNPISGKCDGEIPSPYGGWKGRRPGSVGGGKPFGKGKIGGDIIPAGIYSPIIGDDGPTTAIKAAALCKDLKIQIAIFWGANNYADALPPSRCWIVWDKMTTGNFSDAELAWTNLDAPVRLFRHQWSGLMKASERGERRVHPTQKPVALAAWCFEEFGKRGDVVLDLFLGSAPSLIAAEQSGRKLLGMELAPPYVDVAVQRWQNFADAKATLDGDGRTFDELSALRAPEQLASAVG